MKLRGLTLTLRCPDHGLLSLRCAHPELANRPLGAAIMAVGIVLILTGVINLVG